MFATEVSGMKKFSIFVTFSILIVLCFSQQETINHNRLLEQFQNAEKIYRTADHYSQLAENDESWQPKTDELFEQALQAFKKIETTSPKNSEDSLLLFVKLRSAYIAFYLNQTQAAKHDYLAAFRLKKKLPDVQDSFLFLPLVYTGGMYYVNHQYDSAYYYYKEAEKIKNNYSDKLSGVQRLYNRLGAMFYENGNYFQAQNYFEKAIALMQTSHQVNEGLLANYRINIASCLVKLEKYEAAKKQYQQVLPTGFYANEIFHNLAIIDLHESKFTSALAALQKIKYNNNNKIIQLYYNKAMAWDGLKNEDSTQFYLTKALAENKKRNAQQKNISYGLIMKFYADKAVKNKSFDTALIYYQKALQAFDNNFTSNETKQNPTSFNGVFSYINLFNTLTSKAHTFNLLYQKENNIDYLINALATYKTAFQLADYIEKTYDSDIARLFLGKIKYTAHNEPIEIGLQLFKKTGDKKYLNDSWLLDQGNKASLLSLYALESEGKKLIKNNAELLDQELSLKRNITRLSLQAQQINDQKQLDNTNKQIRDFEIALYQVQEKIKGLPEMKYFTKAKTIPSIESIQQIINDNDALLSFHLSPSHIITFCVRKNTSRYVEFNLTPEVKLTIEKFRKSLQNTTAGHKYDGAADAKKLYQILIKPVLAQLSGIKNLIIIPDDELHYIPFEALQDEQNNYLISHFAIQYIYSASLIQKTSIKGLPDSILSFAPFASAAYQSENSGQLFDRIQYSKEEVNATKGKIFLDTAATKKHFLQYANRYPAIHLATHAQVDNENTDGSFIAFYPDDSDNLLYTKEIYNLQLDSTDLIILSACETGAGQLVKGEGIMSLSRAFAIAGCPNIVASLWNATDKTTAFITRQFYFYLQKGFTKTAALRQAKIDLLQNKKIPPALHTPNHWAHLIYIGDYETTPQNGKTIRILIGLGIILILAFLFFLIKSKLDRS